MAGIKALRRLQYGAEDTAGTAVPATSYWRGIGTIQDNRETVFPPEDVGILTGTDRTYVPRVEALLSLENTEATFEQLPVIFNSGIRQVGTSGEWDLAFSSTDALETTDLGTHTWEGGDNQQAERFAFGFCPSFNLTGEAGQALMVNAEIVGRQVATHTFTASLSIPAVEEILFSRGTLNIHASNFPSTDAVSNTLISMNLAVNTGWTQVYTASGNVYFSFVKQQMPEVIWSMTYEHNASAVAEIAAWRAETARSISVVFPGTGSKALTLAAGGKWDNFEKIGERDGNDIVTGNFRARYNATIANVFRAVLDT